MKLNKKAQVKRLIEIAMLLILLVLVIAVFFSPKGLLPKVAEKTNIFKQYIPSRLPFSQKPQIEVTEELQTEFRQFCNIIETFAESKDCLIDYPWFSTLGKFKVKILEGNNSFYAQLINPENRVVEICEIEGIIPTVVAGPDNAAENFYKNYLEDEDRVCAHCNLPEYSEIVRIMIEWEGTDYNEKSISVLFKDGSEIKEDLEDGNILYKPDEKHISFFPTFDGNAGCNADKQGLDDDCLLDSDEYIQNKILKCQI